MSNWVVISEKNIDVFIPNPLAETITWTNSDQIDWPIYVSTGFIMLSANDKSLCNQHAGDFQYGAILYIM